MLASRRDALRLLAATGIGAGLIGGRPAAAAQPATTAAPVPKLFGVLEPDKPPLSTVDLPAEYQDGLRLREVGVGWGSCNTAPDSFNDSYLATIGERLDAYRGAGFGIQLDVGMQYPPAWVLGLPDSHFVNQFGAQFTPGPGDGGVNAVFNQAMRDLQADYVAHVFDVLGTDLAGVRLGWGHFGEIGYPTPIYGSSTNCYWAFDDIAQGKTAGLPAGIPPCPVPGWMPGTDGVHEAAIFIDWYLNALRNYQQWQIATVREHFAGPLVVLYGSRGVRPGQLSAAVAARLNGSTAAETDSDLQRGFDYARLISSIHDRNVAPCTTWIDCTYENPDDTSPDPAKWSPVHYFASLAEPLGLQVWSENTGHNDYAAMLLSFVRMQTYRVHVLMWAFHADLFSGQYATMAQYAALIAQYT